MQNFRNYELHESSKFNSLLFDNLHIHSHKQLHSIKATIAFIAVAELPNDAQ